MRRARRALMALGILAVLGGPLAGDACAIMFSVVHDSGHPGRAPGDFTKIWDVAVHTDLNRIGASSGWHLPPRLGGETFILEIFNRSLGQLGQPSGLMAPWRDGHGRYRFMLEEVPQHYRDQIYFGGYLSLPWEFARKYVWDKKEGTTLVGQAWSLITPRDKTIEACRYKCDVSACLQVYGGGDPADPDWLAQMQKHCTCVTMDVGGLYCKPKFLKTINLPLGMAR